MPRAISLPPAHDAAPLLRLRLLSWSRYSRLRLCCVVSFTTLTAFTLRHLMPLIVTTGVCRALAFALCQPRLFLYAIDFATIHAGLPAPCRQPLRAIFPQMPRYGQTSVTKRCYAIRVIYAMLLYAAARPARLPRV